MIAYDKHQCTNHCLCIAEIHWYNTVLRPMWHYVRSHFKYTLHGYNSIRLLIDFIP